jgi:hypothetical protein
VKIAGISSRFLLLTLGLVLAACGDTTDDMTDGGLGGTSGAGGAGGGGAGGAGGAGGTTADGGTQPDTAGGKIYKWIAIVDNDKMPECTTTGPGADIDAVDFHRGGGVSATGVGLTGSATLATQSGATACTKCGSAADCPNSGAGTAARAEGIRDGMSYTNKPDTGYVSLNGGILWLQIGSANGGGSAQEITSGDTLTVYEVDKYYLKDGSAEAGCVCLPEKYSVWAYVDKTDETTRVQLTPTTFKTDNSATCSSAQGGTLGCGTTDFKVP